VLLDPTDQFIENITRACDVDGKSVLEIGCGAGRITSDLASRAREVVAVDPDAVALRRARAQVTTGNVVFLEATAEPLELPGRSFDAAVFSLSLHHVPAEAMDASLLRASRQVRAGGRIVVIEPGDEGTLIEAETRFCVGDGDVGGEDGGAASDPAARTVERGRDGAVPDAVPFPGRSRLSRAPPPARGGVRGRGRAGPLPCVASRRRPDRALGRAADGRAGAGARVIRRARPSKVRRPARPCDLAGPMMSDELECLDPESNQGHGDLQAAFRIGQGRGIPMEDAGRGGAL